MVFFTMQAKRYLQSLHFTSNRWVSTSHKTDGKRGKSGFVHHHLLQLFILKCANWPPFITVTSGNIISKFGTRFFDFFQ